MKKQIQFKDGRAYFFAELGSEVETREMLLNGSFDVVYRDNRLFTIKQRKFYFALLNEIYAWSFQPITELRQYFEVVQYFGKHGKIFSFNDNSENTTTEANLIIDEVIEFILKYDVPTKKEVWKDNTSQSFVYKCMMYRKCCECGKNAEVHHVDTIGSGMNRNEVQHIGRRALPLCREHHMEIHNIGLEKFKEKYHVEEITITREIVEKLKIRGIEIKED